MEYIPFHSNCSESNGQADDVQARQYKLLEELQILVQKLPMNMQQRLSHSFLSDVAAVLLNKSIFTIVGDLQEIQHLTEKNLHAQRQKLKLDQKSLKQELKIKQKAELQTCRPHNLTLMQTEHEKQRNELEKRLQIEMQQMDKKLLDEIDQRVTAQQTTLQSVGVPGFFVTTNPKEIKFQMTVLQLIQDLSVS